MKHMNIKLTYLIPGLFIILFSCNSAPSGEGAQTRLFDGQSLQGWIQKNGSAIFQVVDGMIVGRTVSGSPNSFLCTENDYTDFILELEVWVDPELNSGIQIRSHSMKEFNDGRVHGCQVEIDPSDRAWSGGIYDEGRRGWLYDLEDNEAGRKAFKINEWNHYKIEAIGPRIRTWVNGVPAADLIDTVDSSGFIGLQVHSHQKEGLQVKWRNIRIQEVESK